MPNKLKFDREIFAKNLKFLREAAGISQEDLAKYLAVDDELPRGSKISRWERAEARPSVETLPSIAQGLGVPVEDLFAGNCVPKSCCSSGGCLEVSDDEKS